MHRRNAMVLLGVLLGSALVMVGTRLLLFPSAQFIGAPGLGVTAVVLLFLNRHWLAAGAPPLSRAALYVSIAVALGLGIAFGVLFGTLL